MLEEVARPPQVMFGVLPRDEMMGQVAVTAVTVPLVSISVDVATHPMPLVLLFQPRTMPPVLAP